MKTIKVIDLINKIAKGEKIPKKIRIDHWCYKFEWVEHLNNYYDKDIDIDLTSALSLDIEELNYGVHILDEEDEFEDIEEIGGVTVLGNDYMPIICKVTNKVDKLIKNQKKIIERLQHENSKDNV